MKQLLTAFFSVLLLLACGNSGKPTDGTDDLVIVSTEFGDMVIRLYDDVPAHKANFLELAGKGFFDGTTFHRVMSEFMIQGGDPNSKDTVPFNDGQGGPGYTLKAEFNSKYFHKKGAVAAARQPDQVNPERRSNGSQFYIVHGKKVPEAELTMMEEQQNNNAKQMMIREYMQHPENQSVRDRYNRAASSGDQDQIRAFLEDIEPKATAGFTPFSFTEEQKKIYTTEGGAPFLDGNYTVFGQVIDGLDVIDAIAAQKVGNANRPLSDIKMTVKVKTMDRSEIENTYGISYE